MPATLPPEGMFNADLRGVHYDFLKDRIPAWFRQANPRRQQELAAHPLQLPDGYAAAKPALSASHARWRAALNAIDARLGAIEDIAAFAAPKLKAALKQQLGLDLDVTKVYFARKYGFKSRDDLYGFFVFDQTDAAAAHYRYRGLTLLEAALANFELAEEQPAPCADCQIITAWGSYDDEVTPSYEVLADHAVAITPHAFARLCRTLDLGAQYQAHITALVQPADASTRQALEQQLEQHHREPLALTIQLAGLSADARQMLDQLLAGRADASLAGRPVTLAALKVFGTVLVGPLLIGPDRLSSDRPERLVVYLPNDPQQPLKEYASSGEFMADLRTRLHGIAYRQFFSRFIPAREQGTFFQQFNRLYQPAEGAGPAADYPLQPRVPRLPLDEVAINGNLWTQLRQAQVRKIFADARAVAVPTGDEDRIARLDRLQSYFDAVVSVFNLAAFVVPGLGPLMLAVGAAQLCDEAFEGIEAFERGETREMWAHLASVGLNVVAVGTGAKVLPQVRLSSLVDGLQPVTLANGKQKLWRGDLEPYKAAITLPGDAQPDASGLYTHEGQTVLALDGAPYWLRQEPGSGEYRIRHPSRAGAYEPRLAHNGLGAWHHELEQPLTWRGARLMRRLGPVVEGFSDGELEQIRHVSGVDEAVLRRVHADSLPTPAILLDTVRQFRAYASAVEVARGIGADALPDSLCGYAATLAVELPGWPAQMAIEAFAGPGLSGPSVKYGQVGAAPRDTLSVSRAELMAGKLPERIAGFLNEAQMDRLVGRYTVRQARVGAVKAQLQARAGLVRERLMRSLYTDQQPMADAAEALVQRDFKQLPTLMVRELLAELAPTPRAALNRAMRLPLDLAQKARVLLQQTRLAHAYEGVFLDALANQDTEALVLNTLKNLPGWVDDLRLEVRDGELEGALRASFGSLDASERKVLVRVGAGRYEARNVRDEHLHGTDDLYASLQHALPDRHRQALGLPHVSQGAQLKQEIIANALTRDQLRGVLDMRTPQRSFFRSPVIRAGHVGYPLTGRGQGASAVTVRDRIRRLYPQMSDAGLSDFLETRDVSNDTWLRTLEQEYKDLDEALTRWLWIDTGRPSWGARRRISRAIRNAWRNSSTQWDVDLRGFYRGQTIELEGEAFGRELATLPPLPGNFNHVTGVILSNCGLAEEGTVFLSTFRKLRALDLSGNGLTRLPPVVEQMPFLEHLALDENEIALTAESAANLGGKVALEMLSLEGNPLGRTLDISRLGQLKLLFLANCEQTQWPAGLFAKPRPRGFVLDLTSNPLSEIPEVAPGSERAQILARTALDRDQVTPQVLEKLKLYIESVGLDPNRNLPPRGTLDSAYWMSGLTQQQWLEKQPIWDAVEEAEGAEPFFDELRKLRTSSDARQPAYMAQLTAKVWQMLEAMAADGDLREHLFQMAWAPTTCVDAGAQLFNAMGVEVLVQQARAILDEPLRTRTLLDLAVGKSRLDELGRIAKAKVAELVSEGLRFPVYDEEGDVITQYDAAGNALRSIDEVEIHLAYHTELAGPLDLPWQSRSMMFLEPNVTAQDLESAYKRIEALERGDLLRERIIEQPFWADYVQASYGEDFQAVENKIEALTDLLIAQQEWKADGRLSAVQKQTLRDTIHMAGRVLGRSAEQLGEGQVMTDAQYNQEMTVLGRSRSSVLVTLTGRLLGRLPGNTLAPWAPGVLPQNRK